MIYLLLFIYLPALVYFVYEAFSNAVKQADHERSEPYDGWTSDH